MITVNAESNLLSSVYYYIYILYLIMRTGLYILLKPLNEIGDVGSMGILQVY